MEERIVFILTIADNMQTIKFAYIKSIENLIASLKQPTHKWGEIPRSAAAHKHAFKLKKKKGQDSLSKAQSKYRYRHSVLHSSLERVTGMSQFVVLSTCMKAILHHTLHSTLNSASAFILKMYWLHKFHFGAQ